MDEEGRGETPGVRQQADHIAVHGDGSGGGSLGLVEVMTNKRVCGVLNGVDEWVLAPADYHISISHRSCWRVVSSETVNDVLHAVLHKTCQPTTCRSLQPAEETCMCILNAYSLTTTKPAHLFKT